MRALWRVVLFAGLTFAADARPESALRLRQLLENRPDPRIEYRTTRSAHFLVHHPQALDRDARHIIDKAEAAYAAVSTTLGARLDDRTHLVLSNRSDQPAAFSSVFPERLLFFDVALPHQAIGLNEFGDYHQWLFTHELTHLLHLDQRRGLYRPLSFVLGSWVRPALAQPPWLKEGVAIWTETRLTGHGRLHGSTYRAMTRMAVHDGLLESGAFATKDTAASYDARTWPWTFRPYLVGSLLLGELLEKDPFALPKIITANAVAAPYFINHVIERASDRDFETLWRDTFNAARIAARRELEAIERAPLTDLHYLTETGFAYHGLALSHDGRTLFVTRENPSEENALMRISLSDGVATAAPEVVTLRSTGYQTSVSRSNRFVAFDQVSRTSRHYLLSDVYLLDLKTNELAGVSPRIRARDPDIHPDGKHLVFVVNDGGRNRLVESDTLFEDARDLLGDVGFRRLSGPRYSPDGQLVALTVRNPQTGGEDLWLVTPEGAGPLIADGHHNQHPSWAADGRYILFSSDRDGVFNVHAVEVSSARRFQLSNVRGGLSWPVADAGKRFIYAVSYRGGGDDIARFHWDETTWKELPRTPPRVETAIDPRAERSIDPPTREDSPSNPRTTEPSLTASTDTSAYKPLRYLAPHYVAPSLVLRPNTVQLGLSTGGEDPLGFHAWELDVRYDTATKLPVGRLFIFEGATLLPIDATIARDAVQAGPSAARLDVLSADLHASIPLDDDGVHFHLRPGAFARRIQFLGTSIQGGPSLNLRYDTTFQQLGQSFPESGLLLDVSVNHLFGTRGTATWLEGRIEKHIGLGGRRHTLHLRAEGGMQLLPPEDPNSVFFAGGRLPFPFSLGSTFTLYGYAPNAIVASNLAVASIHYTFELIDIGRGPQSLPLFFGRLSSGLRAQAGVQQNPDPRTIPKSAGVELHQELVLGYLFPITATLGLYRGSGPMGETQLLFSLAASR